MAEAVVFQDPYIEVDGSDITQYCTKVKITMSADKISTDAFGSGGSHASKQGMRENSFTITTLADEDGVVDDLLFRLYDNNEEFTVKVRGEGAISATNPNYVSTKCRLFTGDPIDAEVGSTSEVDREITSNMNIYRVFT